MRITIFGATGLLGKALVREWKDDEVTGFASADGDIRDEKQVSNLVQHARPDWIVLAAAYTDVDGCESNRDLAFDVNCRGAVNVARAAKQHGSRLLFLSTDYVFDGTKTTPYETNDPRSPSSVYGHSKAEAEVRLAEILPGCCIVRTSWLFGPGGKCFPDTILKLAETRPELAISAAPQPTQSIWPAPSFSYAAREPAASCTPPTAVTARGTNLLAKSLRRQASKPLCAKPRVTSSYAPPSAPNIPCCPPKACRNSASPCPTGGMR
jgi:uncharacterized protein YbjT (DUF2867 family)